MNDLLRRRRAMMGTKATALPQPIYDVSNVSVETDELDTGVLLLQEGKTGWCVYFDQTCIPGTRRSANSNLIANYISSYWFWCRNGDVVGCNGRMTSDNYPGDVTVLHNAILNANFETMKLAVVLNDGEIVRNIVTIPNRVNSTTPVMFNRTTGQTINRLIIWDRPLTQAEINQVFNTL